MTDRLAKWAIAGSLAWLVMAVGVILGTHGSAHLGARAVDRDDARPAPTWAIMPAATTDVEVAVREFTRC